MKKARWQTAAIKGLSAALRKNRAALLQLPTGMGKSLVAIELYKKLRAKKKGLRLLVVLPKKNIPAGWKEALEPEKLTFGEDTKIRGFGCVRFETRLQFRKKFLDLKQGRPQKALLDFPYFVVLDESHKHGTQNSIIGIMARVFEQDGQFESVRVSRSMQQSQDLRRQWPKWLLVSATPINPVEIDHMDPCDTGRHGTDDPDEGEKHLEERIILSSVRKTYGALAQLAGLKKDHWFESYMEKLEEVLQKESTDFIKPPKELAIYPRKLSGSFHPSKRPRWRGLPEPIKCDTGSAIGQLIDCQKKIFSLDGGKNKFSRTTFERMLLSGGSMEIKIKGKERGVEGVIGYGPGLVAALGNAMNSKPPLLTKTEDALKVNCLLEFIEAANGHILVFCVHRAVAKSIAGKIGNSIGENAVRYGNGTQLGKTDIDWFNEKTRGEKRVLVVTDACSESIDLHKKANILVHYELPWSPLRVLQRVGRLWRIRDGASRKKAIQLPALPGVVHFVHPGSIDEEILNRLQRRWHYLQVLGIDFLSYEKALGRRIPEDDR